MIANRVAARDTGMFRFNVRVHFLHFLLRQLTGHSTDDMDMVRV